MSPKPLGWIGHWIDGDGTCCVFISIGPNIMLRATETGGIEAWEPSEFAPDDCLEWHAPMDACVMQDWTAYDS